MLRPSRFDEFTMRALGGASHAAMSEPENISRQLLEARRGLAEATKNCYRVFAKFPAPTEWDAPPYREPEQLLVTLTSVPLRELSDDPLGTYAFWAMTTVGDPAHYKHFLPRILELGWGEHSYIGLDGWLIADKLDYGHWRTWPDEERSAVEAFFLAAWSCLVNDSGIAYMSDDWFPGIARIGTVLPDAFKIWERATEHSAAIAMGHVISRNLDDVFFPEADDRSRKSYIDDESRRMVADWLTDTVRPRMWSIFARLTFDDDFVAFMIQKAIDDLETAKLAQNGAARI
jgi:hypothetical protein